MLRLLVKKRFLYFLILCLLSPIVFANEKPTSPTSLKIAYISSDGPSFWRKTWQFAAAVADDLDIDFQHISAETPEEKLAAFKRLVQSEQKPDYLIFSYSRNLGSQVMQLALDTNIKVFLVNSDIPKIERRRTLQPRVKFSNWLGHMYPDDIEVGYELADHLIKLAKNNNKPQHAHNEPLLAIGVSGPSHHLPAALRSKGLQARISQGDDSKLIRLANSNWHSAHKALTTMFKSHKGFNIVWAASDQLAIEAAEVAQTFSLVSGRDFYTGGIDWSPSGIEAVKNGLISVTFGGHLWEAGWAVILLHDYHHGIDFKDELGVDIRTQLFPITNENVDSAKALLSNQNWDVIDYRLFSKFHNNNLEQYQLNAKQLLQAYRLLNSPIQSAE